MIKIEELQMLHLGDTFQTVATLLPKAVDGSISKEDYETLHNSIILYDIHCQISNCLNDLRSTYSELSSKLWMMDPNNRGKAQFSS
jgi:hypothetical protein